MRTLVKAAALGLTLSVAACGGGGERSGEGAPSTSSTPSVETTAPATGAPIEPNDELTCVAETPEDWLTPMTGLNTQAIGDALGVPSASVADGLMGPANCTPEVPASEATSVVTAVEGIGSVCLSVGVMSDAPPAAGQTYGQLLMLCAAEPTSI